MGWDGQNFVASGNQPRGGTPRLHEVMRVEGEAVWDKLQGLREGLIRTDRRLISMDVQGLTREHMSFPYLSAAKVSVDVAGRFVRDAELKV